MKNQKKLIKEAIRVIGLSYNQFNLANYKCILHKNFSFEDVYTSSTGPIKLMSGQHENSGIIRHRADNNVTLIGKGLLFDSGGYNLKRDMEGMAGDMAGMAVALTAANLAKVNAYCPIATNLIHNNQILPGDILQIGNKKVEVSNTDAEGRLVLAEAITELNASKNEIIITIATLTGACVYAVGEAVAVLSPNDKLALKFLEASGKEKLDSWQLPLWPKYQKKFYDKPVIKNSNKGFHADTIGGGMFVQQFVKYPDQWLHIDIAAIDIKKDGEKLIKTLIRFVNSIKK